MGPFVGADIEKQAAGVAAKHRPVREPHVDNPFFWKNIYCTRHGDDDQFCAACWGDGQWMHPPQNTMLSAAELVEALMAHLAGEHDPLSPDEVRAIRVAVALGAPDQGLKMLVECSQPEP